MNLFEDDGWNRFVSIHSTFTLDTILHVRHLPKDLLMIYFVVCILSLLNLLAFFLVTTVSSFTCSYLHVFALHQLNIKFQHILFNTHNFSDLICVWHLSEGKSWRNTHRVSRRLTASREAQTTYWQKFDVNLVHTYKNFILKPETSRL